MAGQIRNLRKIKAFGAEAITAARQTTAFKSEKNRMANTKSAKKAVRKIARRTEVNRSRRSRMRTYVRAVEEAITAGDQKAASEALRKAQPEVMRAAQKNVLHHNTASRKISRLSARVHAMSA